MSKVFEGPALDEFLLPLDDRHKTLFLLHYGLERKNRSTALLLSVLLGVVGIDRLYLGDYFLGSAKLLAGLLALAWLQSVNLASITPDNPAPPLVLFGLLFATAWLIWCVADVFLIQRRADVINRAKAREIFASLNNSSAVPPPLPPIRI